MTDRILLVLVPGAYFRPGDFAAHGLLDALRDRPIDVIESRLPAERYLEGDAASWLHGECIAPFPGRRIWLLGISLGAMGALLTAQRAPDLVEGLILLAPFLGTRGLIADIAAQGGLTRWDPGPIAPAATERRMLANLRTRPPPRLYLGYGSQDRFADAGRMLAELLPPARVAVADCGHNWACWATLWSQILARAPFDDKADRKGTAVTCAH